MATIQQKAQSYQEKINAERTQKIRELLRSLPSSCTDFIRSIAITTSALTRMAYTIDLRVFFDYAFKELPIFDSEKPSQVTDAEIGRLKPRDLDGYSDYLTLYFNQTDAEADEPALRPLRNHEYGIMRKLSSLRSYFEYMFRLGRIPGNIATLVPLPKLHEKPILFLEDNEIKRLLQIAYDGDALTDRQRKYHEHTYLRDYAMLMLFLGTGVRVSECVGVDLEDIDFTSNALLVVRKGGDQVILYFPQEVADALLAYRDERMLIETLPGHEHAFFLSMQRRRITQRAVQQMVKKYCAAVVPLKKKMSPHKLRSTYATHLYRETQDIYLVAEALGHADVNTTRKHYAAMSDARRRSAATHTHLPAQGEANTLDESPEFEAHDSSTD